MLIIYKRFHSKILQNILHKWQIITLKLNYGIYDFNSIINTKGYDNELLVEPQLEKKPYLYLNNIKNNVKNSTIK